MTLKTTVYNPVDQLTSVKEIKWYLLAHFMDADDDLDLLQAMLEDSVKAVIKLRQEQGEHDEDNA